MANRQRTDTSSGERLQEASEAVTDEARRAYAQQEQHTDNMNPVSKISQQSSRGCPDYDERSNPSKSKHGGEMRENSGDKHPMSIHEGGFGITSESTPELALGCARQMKNFRSYQNEHSTQLLATDVELVGAPLC